jgi:hypothetical protein
LRDAASRNPDVHFIAVSHSDASSTEHWLEKVGGPGTANPVQVIVDADLQTYAAWGLGTSSFAHVLNLGGLFAVYKLGKEKGIWNRPTESGSRWQTAGSWSVDAQGVVRWGGPSKRADEVPEFEEAVKAARVVGGVRL